MYKLRSAGHWIIQKGRSEPPDSSEISTIYDQNAELIIGYSRNADPNLLILLGDNGYACSVLLWTF
jgi:hypothetical protein